MAFHSTSEKGEDSLKATYHSSISMADFSLWERIKTKRTVVSFDLEVTARCNNNCRHCYINLPVDDKAAKQKELSVEEIGDIADQAVALGAVWCLITGGEPLLRPDFAEIYMTLKRKGLLVSVFTNATLISEAHILLFKKYPPRDIEVTVYGVTRGTYEKISRRSGSFGRFMKGLKMLLDAGVRIRLKAMALQSNLHEHQAIAKFCRLRTKDYYRFDPQLHLRFDRDAGRNAEIKAERLTPRQIVELEIDEKARIDNMRKRREILIKEEFTQYTCKHLFHCGTGNRNFIVSYDGYFRLCSSLWHPKCIYDLKKGSLSDAWHNFVPKVRKMRSNRNEYLQRCRVCPLMNLCMWCPAHAYLESGEMDAHVDYFCEVAHARAEVLTKRKGEGEAA